MTPYELWLRSMAEPLTYLLFFGLLVGLAVLEPAIPTRQAGHDRWRRWPVNFGLTALNIVVLGFLPVSALIAADWAQAGGHGWLNQRPHSPAMLLILGFMGRSLASWVTHWAMHNVPVLWRVHRVHHTDTHLDVSTTVRFHPLEFVIGLPLVLASVVFLGLPPWVVILYELFDTALAVITHANLRMPNWLDRSLGWLIVTPDLHRIHHSTRVPETNSNYGATLTLWDRVFGTYRTKAPDDLATQPLGLDETQDRRASSLWWLLTLPFRPVQIDRQDDL